MNKKLIIIIVSILILFSIGIILLGKNNDNNTIHNVKGEEVRQLLNDHSNAVFIDVRTTSEHLEKGGIDGSIVIPHDEIGSKISKVADKDTIIILYCNTGNRSGQAANTLADLGYKNIYDMGSYQNW